MPERDNSDVVLCSAGDDRMFKALKVVLLGEARKCEPNLRSLTVGDFPGFLEPGDAIEFTCVCKKIQFKATLAAIQGAGLKVSSRMLKHARNLRTVRT